MRRQARAQLFIVLAEELDRLDPRDFLPDAQFTFPILRQRLRGYSKQVEKGWSATFLNIVDPIIEVLQMYGGDGSRAETRSFSFVRDDRLRQIIERDYRKLSLILLPGGAWKSTVIMSGSILEAIYSSLTETHNLIKTRSSTKAPMGKDILKGEWSLHKLIEVGTDIGIVPMQRAETFDRILRDYRNFVHPNVEIREEHPCTEAEALMAKGALDGVCNFLESKNNRSV